MQGQACVVCICLLIQACSMLMVCLNTAAATQVASHAQKYFIRLNSMNKKDKRRSSIHDITSAGLPGSQDITGDSGSSAEHPRPVSDQQMLYAAMPAMCAHGIVNAHIPAEHSGICSSQLTLPAHPARQVPWLCGPDHWCVYRPDDTWHGANGADAANNAPHEWWHSHVCHGNWHAHACACAWPSTSAYAAHSSPCEHARPSCAAAIKPGSLVSNIILLAAPSAA